MPKIISDEMNEKLNKQIGAEFAAAHKYLAMACTFEDMGLQMLAKRFFEQYQEELDHAMRFVKYVLEVDGKVELGAISKPKSGWKSPESIVKDALDGEIAITEMINDITALSEKEKDYATRSFINWFIDEQVEEVSSMQSLLDLISLSKGNMLQVEARVRHEMTKEA